MKKMQFVKRNWILTTTGIISIAWWLLLAYFYINRGTIEHLLWLCDLALLLTGLAFLFKSPTLFSSQFIGTFPIQLVWNLDFWPRFIFNIKLTGWTGYMFSDQHPLMLKLLSLFHVFLLVVMIFGYIKFGYKKTGLYLQILITIFVYIVSYIAGNQTDDTNCVFGLLWKTQHWMNPLLYLLLWSVATIMMYLFFHFTILKLRQTNINKKTFNHVS